MFSNQFQSFFLMLRVSQVQAVGAAYVGSCVSLTRPTGAGYFCAFWSKASSFFIPRLESAKSGLVV